MAALEYGEDVNAVTLHAIHDSIGTYEDLAKVGPTTLANHMASERELSCSLGRS